MASQRVRAVASKFIWATVGAALDYVQQLHRTRPAVTTAGLATPEGLPTWGDGRLIVLGTEGYLELRKYVDVEGRPGGDDLFVVDRAGTEYIDCSDVELTHHADLVHDVINRTETACPQRHTFEVTRLALLAQQQATRVGYAD